MPEDCGSYTLKFSYIMPAFYSIREDKETVPHYRGNQKKRPASLAKHGRKKKKGILGKKKRKKREKMKSNERRDGDKHLRFPRI